MPRRDAVSLLRRAAQCLRAFTVAVVALGCSNPTAPVPIEQQFVTQRYNAPAEYTEWWRQIETCSGKTGDLSAVRWYMNHAAEFLPNSNALARSDYATQVVVVVSKWIFTPGVIRHEMGHLLIKEPGHPVWFKEKCGDLVDDWD
jgi:hypothetical protein